MSEKIIKATPKKRRDARKKGQVAKSTELISMVIIVITCVYVYINSDGLINLMKKSLALSTAYIGRDIDKALFDTFLANMAYAALPIVLIAAVAAVFMNYVQVGFEVAPDAIKPDLSKLDPISGFKRMFSRHSWVELAKSIVKITAVIYVAYNEIKNNIINYIYSGNINYYTSYEKLFELTASIFMKIFIILGIISILDFFFKRYDFERNLMMTKEEFIQEMKQDEGDPLMKQRQKEFQRRLTRKEIQKVKEATVIIKNPTHFAVALRFKQGTDRAPIVLFKGVDFLAQEIKRIGEENNIPIVENRPLARMLYFKTQIGNNIPEDLYEAVIDVFMYLYNINGRL